ncbi:hypothetical protein B6U84_00015 [Candidatus Bathyarchaeota archaeon ex4484_40]|nr:MAG: hypothetical protein B6U84_00015 [Candidatus Bathyarchaeota archaeon ex4484_40]
MKGLYFDGEMMMEEEMLEKILGIPRERQIPTWRSPYGTYSVMPLEPSERLWIWTNVETGKTVITGDEGNGWCVPLIIADSKEEAIRKYIKNPPKAKFRDLFEALEVLVLELEGNGRPHHSEG